MYNEYYDNHRNEKCLCRGCTEGSGWPSLFSDFILLYVDEPIDAVDLTGLKTLTLPAFLTEIEEEAFVGIAAEVVIIPESCTTIGSRAFADCKNLKYIVLPLGSDITPANDAFEGCNAEILYR